MSLIRNTMKVVLLGLNTGSQITIDSLRQQNYLVYIVSKLDDVNHLNNVSIIDEDYLFKNANDFDFAIRSMSVEALNPNVVMLRQFIPVFSSLSLFIDQIKCKVIFNVSGSTMLKPLGSFLEMHGFTVHHWKEGDGIPSINKVFSEESILIVHVCPEDLIDMHVSPTVLLLDSLPIDGAGFIVDYIRTQCLYNYMKGKDFYVLGPYGKEMNTLRDGFSEKVLLCSIGDHQADFFLDKKTLVDNSSNSKREVVRSTFVRGLKCPVSDRQLIQLFALSQIFRL